MESMKFTWTVEFNNRGKNRTKPKIKIAKTSKVEEKKDTKQTNSSQLQCVRLTTVICELSLEPLAVLCKFRFHMKNDSNNLSTGQFLCLKI